MSSMTLQQSRAALALDRSPIPALRKLSLEESEAAVVINGRVSSYYLKQLAQEAIMPVLGGRALLNRVAVIRENGPMPGH
jgi:sulfur carrier protein ThiS